MQGVKSLGHYPKLGGDEMMESLAQLVCANSPSILPLPPYPLLGLHAPTNQTYVPPTFGGTTSASGNLSGMTRLQNTCPCHHM